MTIWYVEVRCGDGWKPVRYQGEKPSRKRIGGPDRVFREEPQEVPGHFAHFTIGQLRDVYSPDGRFQSIKPRQDEGAA